MIKQKLDFIRYLGEDLSATCGKELYWKVLKEQYLTLKTDEEKNAFLARIFQDTKKEG